MKQHIVRIALGLVVMLLFVGHAAKFYQIGLLTQLDNIIYDARLNVTMPGSVDDRIVILDIDEKSLAVPELGRWPWSRDKISGLLTKLFDKYGIVIVGFDVVFAEPDESSGLPVLEKLAKTKLKDVTQYQSLLNELRPELDYDGVMAKTLKGRPIVLGYYFSSDADARVSGAIPEAVLPKGTFQGRNISFTSWRGFGGNLPAFQTAAANGGHFNPFIDPDGVARRVPMLAEYQGAYYESLSLSMFRVLVAIDAATRGTAKSGEALLPKVIPGFPPERFITKGYSGLEWLEVGPRKIPVDETVSAYIPYRGKRGSFKYISLADVYFDKLPVDALKGKIAFVGTTAPGLLDLRSSPVGSVYPGVEIHANLVAGMLDGNIKHKPPYMLGAEVLLLLIGGIALSLLVPFLSPLKATVVSVLAMLLITGLNIAIWSSGGMVLPLASSLLMTIMLFALNMSYGYFVESRSRRQFTELFGQYVPPELVDEMAKDPEKYSMEPKAGHMTILFSDVRGFTSISEALSPEDLKEYINAYLTDMSAIIRKHRGTLDKYIGDAIMAFWGAPVADEEHARNGVITAIEMQKECETLRQKFLARGWPDFKIGVGLNSGNVRVGDMGSKVRKAYTVMGDPVNLASRLEGRTKYYGIGILIGEATKAEVPSVLFKEIDRIKVKGKDTAVTVYEPIGVEAEVDKKVLDEVKLWHQTLKAYRLQQWDQVEVNLLNLQRMHPGSVLYELYAQRTAEFRRNAPPAGWEGVTAFDEK